MSRITDIAREMKTWWSDEGTDVEVQEALDKIIAIDRQAEWIPCNERLPQTYGEYEVTILSNPSKRRIVTMAYFDGLKKEFGTFKTDGSWEKWNVVAWGDKPEPYREDGEV